MWQLPRVAVTSCLRCLFGQYLVKNSFGGGRQSPLEDRVTEDTVGRPRSTRLKPVQAPN